MKVAIRGLARARVLPALWALGVDEAAASEDAAALLCAENDAPREHDPPRVVWTAGPLASSSADGLVRSPPRAPLAPVPEPAADAAMAEVLAALRLEYSRQLPHALAELAQAVIDARSGAAPLADARMLAHRLRGTAGSYGHPAVGAAAGRLETSLVAGELAAGPIAASLAAMAGPVLAALWPGNLVPEPRLLVVGAAPVGVENWLVAPDLAAAARSVAAGEGQALWLTSEDPRALAAVVSEPGLRDIPIAVVRDAAGPAAALALACVWPGAWARLFGPA